METEDKSMDRRPRFSEVMEYGDPLPAAVSLGQDAEPLDFLYAVFRNPNLPLSVRMKAAADALPFAHPKLSAVLQTSVSGEDFGAALERARKRMLEGPQAKLIGGEVKPLPSPGSPR
jgi:hypothetical protein